MDKNKDSSSHKVRLWTHKLRMWMHKLLLWTHKFRMWTHTNTEGYPILPSQINLTRDLLTSSTTAMHEEDCLVRET